MQPGAAAEAATIAERPHATTAMRGRRSRSGVLKYSGGSRVLNGVDYGWSRRRAKSHGVQERITSCGVKGEAPAKRRSDAQGPEAEQLRCDTSRHKLHVSWQSFTITFTFYI